MSRTVKDYIIIGLKGVAMGAADVVPGVSGGTIAFITGIYEELIDSIKSFNLNAIKSIFKSIPEFWTSVNGNFLFALLSGILLSIFSLASLISGLLETHPILVWAFFFGLIVASTIFVAKKVDKWNIYTVIALIIGGVAAYYITIITPTETTDAYWFVFLSGAIAICAMILPGISGSFILLLLGKLQFMYKAISDLNILVLSVFAVGAAVGLLSFSNVLSFLLKKYHNITVAVLTGFMIGSLNKVWPWKHTVQTFFDRHGVEKPLEQINISPSNYTQLTGNDNFLLSAVALAIIGLIIIFVFERLATGNKKVDK